MANRIDFRSITAPFNEGDRGDIDVLAAAFPVFKATNSINQGLKGLELSGIDTSSLIAKLLPGLINFFGRILKNGGTPPVVVVPPAVPDPNQPGVGGDPQPGPKPVRTITSFGLAPFWYQLSAGSDTERTEVFKKIIDRSDPMVERSRLAVDCTIFDQFGKPFFIKHGTQEAIDLLWWPADAGEGLDNTQRMRWFFEDGDDIAEVHDNADGFNPIIKIPLGSIPEKGVDYETGRLWGRFTRSDGETILTPKLQSFRIKK